MRTSMTQILAAPIFENDDGKTRVARLLNVLLLTSGFGSLVIGLAALFLPTRPEPTIRMAALVFVLACVSWILMHRGYVRLASVLILSGFWIFTTIFMFLSDGMNSIFAMGYVTCAVIAGLLLGGRTAVTVAALDLLAGLAMMQAKADGILPPPTLAIRADTAWLILAVNLVVTVSLLYYASRTITEAVRRARRSTAALEQQREYLEQTVAERTRDLEHRAVQLTTAAEVGRAAASILELEPLTRRVVDLVRERFRLYYAALFLLDDAGEYAVLAAGTGEAGQTMKEQGHQLKVHGVSMVGAACARREARVALDVGEEPIRFDNPLLPLTRSEVALPLLVGERVLGALDVQSAEPAAFSEDDIAVLQLVADQVAVAVDNARKFSEEAELLEATSPIFRVSHRLASAVTTNQIVQAILTAVADTEADGCVAGRLNFSPEGVVDSVTFLGEWNRDGASRVQPGATFRTGASPFPLDWVTSHWTVEDASVQPRVPEGIRSFLARVGGRGFVNIPLRVNSHIIGFVSIYRTRTGPFSPVSMRLYETLVDQASVAVERARLLDEAQDRAARERLIAGVSARIRETLEMEAVLSTAVDEISRALGLAALDVRLGTEPASGGLPISGGEGSEIPTPSQQL
jgi:GAF domain-containing protein